MDDHTTMALFMLESAETALIRATNLIAFDASEVQAIHVVLGIISRAKADLLSGGGKRPDHRPGWIDVSRLGWKR